MDRESYTIALTPDRRLCLQMARKPPPPTPNPPAAQAAQRHPAPARPDPAPPADLPTLIQQSAARLQTVYEAVQSAEQAVQAAQVIADRDRARADQSAGKLAEAKRVLAAARLAKAEAMEGHARLVHGGDAGDIGERSAVQGQGQAEPAGLPTLAPPPPRSVRFAHSGPLASAILAALEGAGGPLTMPEIRQAVEAAGVPLKQLDPLGSIYTVATRRPDVFAVEFGESRDEHRVSIRPDARPEDLAKIRARIGPPAAGKVSPPPREDRAERRARAILDVLRAAREPMDVQAIVAGLRLAGTPLPPKDWSAQVAVRNLLAGMPDRVERPRHGLYQIRKVPVAPGGSDLMADQDSAAILGVLGKAKAPLTIGEIIAGLEEAGHHLPDGVEARYGLVRHVIGIRPLDIERVGKDRYRLKEGKPK